jgi:hypothetical protein
VKRGTALIGCLCLAFTLAAAPAQAKKKKPKPSLGPVSTVTAVGSTVGVGSVSTATATCPGGTQAVGGGWTAPFAGTGAAAVFESYRSAPGAWTVSGVIGVGTANVTAYGYCRKVKGSITDSTATSSIAAGTGNQGTASAVCPGAGRLIGGGFQSTRVNTSVGAPQDLYSPSPGVWALRAANSSTMGPLTITAHAYCLAKLKPPKLLNATTTSAPLPTGGTSSVNTGACPKPKKKKKKKGKKKKPQRLSAGGFRTASGLVVWTESRMSGTGWSATANNATGGTAALTLSAQGICA